MFITDAVLEQIVQALGARLWNRPELAPLRQPVEQALNAGSFRTMTRQAFETFSAQVSAALPDHFDAGFIAIPAVQAALAAHIVQGAPIDTAELARLYGRRHLNPADAPDASAQIDGCEIPLEMLDLNVKSLHPDLAAGMRDVIADLAPYKPALPNAPAPQPQNPRDLERDYLNRVLLEHSVWQEVYTPMGGVGQMRQLVVLGDPGSGKTTTLWRIAATFRTRRRSTAP